MSSEEPRCVAVIGGATMGLGIAQVLRFAGLRPPAHLAEVAEVAVVFPATGAVADAAIATNTPSYPIDTAEDQDRPLSEQDARYAAMTEFIGGQR
jgi:hypothetical protein